MAARSERGGGLVRVCGGRFDACVGRGEGAEISAGWRFYDPVRFRCARGGSAVGLPAGCLTGAGLPLSPLLDTDMTMYLEVDRAQHQMQALISTRSVTMVPKQNTSQGVCWVMQSWKPREKRNKMTSSRRGRTASRARHASSHGRCGRPRVPQAPAPSLGSRRRPWRSWPSPAARGLPHASRRAAATSVASAPSAPPESTIRSPADGAAEGGGTGMREGGVRGRGYEGSNTGGDEV